MDLSKITYAILAAGLMLTGIPLELFADEDIFIRARSLALNHQRREALDLLKAHLDRDSEDVDSRLLYGLILSWERRWDEARQALHTVLEKAPGYTDASIGLINVELWSGNTEQADRIARAFLERTPNDANLLLAGARVKRALNRSEEQRSLVDAVLRGDPANREARDMRSALREGARSWDAGLNYNTVIFSDRSSTWHEQALSVRRGISAGSVVFRISRGYRFGDTSNLGEVDWYPRIRPRTYAYLNAGYSPEGVLYPTFRAGAELYQDLGRGYEASAGLRRLQFSTARINVYTASLGRYHSNWYSSARTFITPVNSKPSASVQLQVRRYFGDPERYAGFRYGRGAAPIEIRSLNEVGILDSNSYAGELHWRLGERLVLSATGGMAGQDRVERTRLRQYFFTTTLYLRF